MGRKVLVAAVYWLALCEIWADAKKSLNNLEETVTEATLSRLYRNIPVGVYASSSPYAAFSFHVPTFASSPRITQLGPVKQESVVVENTHAFLKDSYGNKFVQPPQSLAYRTTYPQQYVQLQELPAHLAQPLVSVMPSFQFKQATPHFFGPPHLKVQTLHAASPSTANRYAVNQPHAFTGAIKTLASIQQQQQQQQHPTNNQAVYANTHIAEQFQNLKNVGKLQRLQENPNNHKEESTGPARHITHKDKPHLKAAATATSAQKVQDAVIVTNPSVPLLDLSLLEPLTFANPLVPQVQHFLPRINSVTYHKLPQLNANEIKKEMKQFVIQKTKSYDSGLVKEKPRGNPPRKTQLRPQAEVDTSHHEQVPPAQSSDDVPNEEPEIVYEINSPNYKETYKEKVVSYNKQTQSDPVHYSYDMKTDKQPVHYNYVHTSNEPVEIKNIRHESNGQNPKQLIHHFKPEEKTENQNENHPPHKNKSEEPFNEPSEGNLPFHSGKHAKSHDKEILHHERPEHREEEYHHISGKIMPQNFNHNSPREPSEIKNVPVKNIEAHFHPIIKEYEEDIRLVEAPKPYATIKVNPDQQIQHGQASPNPRKLHDRPHEFSHNHPDAHSRSHYPEPNVHEKSKKIMIKEEIQDEEQPENEHQNEEPAGLEEESEENFEKGYKNAAFGFPAYESNVRDAEKEIYDPIPYGQPKYHADFDFEHSPFQQYQVQGDEFPKSTRSNYKDARDKTKEEYYLDFAISKPESLVARYKQKEDYYKMFMKQKPQYLFNERESDKKNQKSAKYVSVPAFEYYTSAQKPKQYFAKYKVTPRVQAFEYDYSKETPSDNSAHATRPHQRFKTHTQFVEPQFQYGFEPSALPRLLDSELAAMASNNSPESEKPGTRKKIYKENWYIKKTSTNGRKADS